MINSLVNRVQADYQAGPPTQGGSPWKKVLLAGGIGCAVLLLAGALLIGLGVFRLGACISAETDQQHVGQGLQLQVHEFGEALHRRDYDRAFEMVDESRREEMTRQEFADQFDEYRDYLDQSSPFPIDHTRDRKDGGMCDAGDPAEWNDWFLNTYFAGPQSDEALELHLTVQGRMVGEENIEGRIVDWDTRIDRRPMDEDDYAWVARDFHRELRRGNYREAQAMASMFGELERIDRDEFTRQIRPLISRLEEADESRVYGLYPKNHVDVMKVRFLLEGPEENYFVDYLVDRRKQIYGIGDIEPADTVPNDEESGEETEDGDYEEPEAMDVDIEGEEDIEEEQEEEDDDGEAGRAVE